MKLYVWNKNNIIGKPIQIVILAESVINAMEKLKQASPQLYGEVQQFKNFDDLPFQQIEQIKTDSNMTQEQKTSAVVQLLSDTYVDITGFTSKAIKPYEYNLDQERIFINM
jgi:hypothetical protein